MIPSTALPVSVDQARPSRPRSSPPRALQVAVAVGLALAVLATGWWWWSGLTASSVEVAWSPACKGTDVYRYDQSSVPGEGNVELPGQYVVDARPGFQCVIAIMVSNPSRWSVRLSAIDAPFLGPGGGSEVVGGTSAGTPTMKESGTGIDARYPVDRQIPAGGSATINLALSWREAGCNSGGYFSFGDWPVVELSMLGRSHEIAAHQHLVLKTHNGDHQDRSNPIERNC